MSITDDPLKLESRLCFGTYRLNRAFARFYQTLFGETGLTYPKFVILSALAEFGPQSITELSDRAGVETNTLSPLLKRMADFGVITRTRDEKDERRVVLALTDLGRSALQAATQKIDAGFVQLGLDPADVEQSIAFMQLIEKRLEETTPEPLTLDDING